METEQPQPFPAKSEYELKREKKLEEQKALYRKTMIKRVFKIALIVIFAGGGVGALGWYIAKQPNIPPGEIISKSGIHWHPKLSIYSKGAKQEIPANIGIGINHAPMHTHDTSGELHLEFQGLVKKEDITLGRFFKIWGEQFHSTCILDSCNGPDGTVKMFVNGEENTEFENYHIKDKDAIEIKYE